MATPVFEQTNIQLLKDVKKCHDVYEGASKVHTYLIKSNNESNDGFIKRKEISACGTTFKQGVKGFVNILFRDSITIDEQVPDSIQEFYKTADGKRDLNEIAKEITKEVLLSNKVYALVWTPQNTATNAKEEKQKGIRPYVEIITRDRIIDSVTKYDSNGRLERIGVSGTYIKEETRYGVETDTENRIYFNDGTTEIFRETDSGWLLHDTIISNVKEMHIMELTFDEIIDTAPFINEANYQLQHYNHESAKDSYNEKLAFPFVVTWGMMANNRGIATQTIDDDGQTVQKVEFQANKGIDFSMSDEGKKLGDVEIKELSGDADAVLKSTIEDKKKSIVDGFIKLTSETSGNKTIEQSENERASGESAVSELSFKVENFLNQLHRLFSLFMSQEPKGEITTNKEFIKQGLTELKYKMLNDLYIDETLDREAYLTELKNNGELTTLDIEALTKRLTATGRA